MTFKELLKTADSHESFNTNNAWGFGGAYGTRYFYPNDVEIVVGTYCYRHTPSRPYVCVSHDNALIIDRIAHNMSPSEIELTLNHINNVH